MKEVDWLAERFEAERPHLRAVAYRMLGSLAEAEDAVQELWLRLTRADTSHVENLGGWLTTVIARICLDVLRTRTSQREESLTAHVTDPIVSRERGIDPEQEAVLADSVGLALLVILDRLVPAERIAFVLHDIFDVPFDEIAPIVGRTSTATRQLASRARRRVRGTSVHSDEHFLQNKAVVAAFLAASRGGNFNALLVLLDPDVVMRTDFAARPGGAPREVRSAQHVAKLYSGRAQGAHLVGVNGSVGLLVAPLGRLLLVIIPTITDGKISEITVIADPAKLSQIDLHVLAG